MTVKTLNIKKNEQAFQGRWPLLRSQNWSHALKTLWTLLPRKCTSRRISFSKDCTGPFAKHPLRTQGRVLLRRNAFLEIAVMQGVCTTCWTLRVTEVRRLLLSRWPLKRTEPALVSNEYLSGLKWRILSASLTLVLAFFYVVGLDEAASLNSPWFQRRLTKFQFSNFC